MTRRQDNEIPQKPITSLRPARTLVVARNLADGQAFVRGKTLINPLVVTHTEQLGGIRFHRALIMCTPTANLNPRYTEIRAAIAAKVNPQPAHGEGAA
ncbi:hypothetical protein [Prescottella agglutinans]|uniref:Uncharacterized protein n=1 Tax=Prescottella agglutinans TaxID=1644129 RepID=A0ABT6M5C5_9NOCA|nr:hypothetical protein [Prescottella agglutinans]MDH6279495.1 hypothetical protein [Prescottella agglutinans]